MAKVTHLSKAPIIEAIIDFRVKQNEKFDISSLSTLKSNLEKQFPKSAETRFCNFSINKDSKNKIETHKEGLLGYLLKTEDEKNALQLRADGFSYSRLHPYTEWEDLFSEAKRLWDLYKQASCPETVTRIAIRYINHINIPTDIVNFADYLESPPAIPKGIPQTINNFVTKIVFTYLKQNIMANYIQAFESRGKQNVPVIILDIDVYQQMEYEPDNDDMWSLFAQFREIKNDLFFSNITEKTVEMYK